MINWQSILSSFDDKPTLLEWLKKVQKALNESALTTVTVTQEKTGRVNSITLTFNFQDGTKIVAPAFTVNDGKDAPVLYRHNICFTSTDPNKIIKFRFIVPSSNNLEVVSLADLKTLLGNTFTYPVNGAYAAGNKSIYEITETGFKAGVEEYTLYDHAETYPAGTWTDTVTTI